jgi:hypothetical protein
MPPDRRKILLVIQFWSGDREKAMRLARLIADIEPVRNPLFEVAFFARSDARHDLPSVEAVSRKFNVWKLKCRRPGTGWPDGCNAMALDMIHLAYERSAAEWKDFKAVYLMESDLMPMRRDWLAAIADEWDSAEANGKYILGSWYPFHSEVGHINGNMLFSPLLIARLRGLDECPPGKAWDTEFAPRFAPHWQKSRIMANHYDWQKDIPPEVLFAPVDGITPVAIVHGVKDLSAERQVRALLFPA